MIDFKRLNASLPARDVADLLGLDCHRVSRLWWRGRCPFHGSGAPHSRSFQVNCELRMYYCHRCHVQGDLIDLAAKVWCVGMWVAAKRLADRFGQP